MKSYLDVGKFAAPRWLMYPELSCTTIGWRMGYGESYWRSIPFETEEFDKLFQKPLNWLYYLEEGRNGADKLEKYSFFARFWRMDGIQKYSILGEDKIVVNDFITLNQVDKEFRLNAMHFSSIRNYILCAKYDLFNKPHDEFDFTNLDDDFELTESQQELWNHYKYSACLNGAYYKIMADDKLKQTLLDTGDKSLVYISDDEWGGDENLFGFALMELRDEIRRLYKNNDRIDWEYSEYLVHNPRY
ncbi:MAG: NADAR family protein [Methanobrevibacter thaueri]|nr:NADAR family protein [Methanobrevibacter thaueri]